MLKNRQKKLLFTDKYDSVRVLIHIFQKNINQRNTTVFTVVLPLTNVTKYLQINTWEFPYWPCYHPETPILARCATWVEV
jgi:hypothetical protein